VGCPFAARCKYVKDKCRQENPPLEAHSPGHNVACWVDIDTGELR
jgi:oligopeptide/dipeptide ABC transporter ATP-binding protein